MECLVTRFMVMILREFGVNPLRIKVRNVDILERDGRWSRYGVRTEKFMNMVVVHSGFMVVAWVTASTELRRNSSDATFSVKIGYDVITSILLRERLAEIHILSTLTNGNQIRACLYTKHSQELLEYVIGTCPKDFNQRDKKHAATPLTRKKQVTFEDQCETSNSNTHTNVAQLNIQKTNVPVPPSTGVNSCTDASGSQPRSNTKKNRILPAKSVNKKKVEEHPRTNKSSLKTTNRIDSSISSKRTVINSNSHSVCKTCNKCLISANHDMCVVNYLHSVNASPSVKNVVRKVQQVWKPKQVKQVWKPTGKILTNVGYQWMPTGRTFTLGEQCPLTRLTKSKVVPAKQTENVSTSKTMITRKLSHTFQKPLTRYQRKNQPYQAVPGSIPTPPENKAIAYANQLDPNQNWGSNFPNSPSSFVFKCRTVRFGNDHFGAIMGHGDYVIADIPKTPQQNGVVKRWNRTLVEAARTMLIFSKALMFLWAEAVATACYTQNRSLIHTRHNKTPYELVHDKKPDLNFFRVFGALCYPTNDMGGIIGKYNQHR
ncbi:retrovirus-related pol polyprotein from transposon TNT 1-94 [Tanacetum coccineum]